MESGFIRVADIKDIQPSQMKEVQVEGESVCIANVGGKYYAIGNICTHEGGPLADGALNGYEVECPWHNSKFDVRTGKVTSPPADKPEPVYEVKIEGNDIFIKYGIYCINEYSAVISLLTTHSLPLQQPFLQHFPVF